MKKALFSVLVVFCCVSLFMGCSKSPAVTTINPYLTASVGTYNFTSETVVPALIDTQANDTTTILQITGNTSDPAYQGDKIVLYINQWHGKAGVYSMVQGFANGIYVHSGISDPALGGIVAVTQVTSNSIIGYFNFNTASGVIITNGEFSVGKPWNY